MTRRIRLHFACNNNSGAFAGRAWMAQIESLYPVGRHSWEAELTHDRWGYGVPLTVHDTALKLRLHRVWFPIKARRVWHGNMAWDSFDFERGTGKRLLALMREHGQWQCEAGPSTFCRWWNVTSKGGA